MSWLSKAAKSVTPVLSTITGGVSDWLFGKPGPSNPYGVQNPSYLLNPEVYDFMKKAQTNPYIAKLPENMKSFSSVYKPPALTSENYFQDLIKNINAPSSVDEVQKRIEDEQVQNLLRDIGRETEASVASSTMDFADRGLGGPGQMSDIEAVERARLKGQGEELGANVRLAALNKEIEREKAKEDALRTAYGTRYGAGVEADTQGRNIAAQGAIADIGAYTDLLKEQANLSSSDLNRQAQLDQARAALISGDTKTYAEIMARLYSGGQEMKYKYAQPGVMDYFGKNLGSSFGETLGTGGGKGLLSALGL